LSGAAGFNACAKSAEARRREDRAALYDLAANGFRLRGR
jgi:hypothetical protein